MKFTIKRYRSLSPIAISVVHADPHGFREDSQTATLSYEVEDGRSTTSEIQREFWLVGHEVSHIPPFTDFVPLTDYKTCAL